MSIIKRSQKCSRLYRVINLNVLIHIYRSYASINDASIVCACFCVSVSMSLCQGVSLFRAQKETPCNSFCKSVGLMSEVCLSGVKG